MRKIILVGFFVTILTTLNGQDYFPFPTSNADWNVLLIYGGMDEPPDTSLLRYSIDGNIEINELNYSIIYKETGDTISPVKDTIGFVREENKIIYYMGQDFLDSYIVEEIILYDFSKSIGDTIVHFPNMDYFFSVIEDIDSILIGENYRKRYKVFTQNNLFEDEEYWIEGIGSIKNGLFGHITDWPICCYHYWEHVCFKENDELVYKNPSYEDCYPYDLLSSIETEKYNNLSIQIFPNPIKDELNITGLKNKTEITIEIINYLGQIINQKQIQNSDLIKMDFDYPSGLYIIRIKDSNKKTITSEKLIK